METTNPNKGNNMSIFGKSRDGGSSNFIKKNYWKLKDGQQVFRILPALGELAKDGVWSKYYSVHFGYKNSEGKHRPFQSPEVKNNKTRMIEVPDAARQRIETLKAQGEKAKASGDKSTFEKVGKALKIFNLDNNHYVNAMDEHGNIGVLKLRHRAKTALDTLIKKLEKDGIDPRDPVNGRFLVFERSGNGTDTQFVISVKQEDLDVPGVGKVKRDVVSALTPEMADRMGSTQKDGSFKYKEASNLLTLFRKPSASEVERIVKEGVTAVDEIFDTKKEAVVTSTDEFSDEYGLNTIVETEVSAPAVESVKVQEVEPKPSLVVKASPSPTTPTSSTKTTAEILAEQSNEDFFKSLGVNI